MEVWEGGGWGAVGWEGGVKECCVWVLVDDETDKTRVIRDIIFRHQATRASLQSTATGH